MYKKMIGLSLVMCASVYASENKSPYRYFDSAKASLYAKNVKAKAWSMQLPSGETIAEWNRGAIDQAKREGDPFKAGMALFGDYQYANKEEAMARETYYWSLQCAAKYGQVRVAHKLAKRWYGGLNNEVLKEKLPEADYKEFCDLCVRPVQDASIFWCGELYDDVRAVHNVMKADVATTQTSSAPTDNHE
jgi:hypothetical protein